MRLWMQAGVESGREFYAPKFEAAVGRVVTLAQKAQVLDAVLTPIEDLRISLRDFERSLQLGVFDLIKLQKQGIKGIPFLALRTRIDDLLVELEQFEPMLAQLEPLAPLSPVYEALWKSLEGRVLLSKEIRIEQGIDGDDSVVRKRIDFLRKHGRPIHRMGSMGYYRPDAPPPAQGDRMKLA